MVECINNPEICSRSAFCVSRDGGDELKRVMNEVLESTILSDLIRTAKAKRTSCDGNASHLKKTETTCSSKKGGGA